MTVEKTPPRVRIVLPGAGRSRPERILLDTNAVGNLFDYPAWGKEKLSGARRALRKAVETDVVQVVVQHHLIEEVLPISHSRPALYVMVLDEIRALSGGRILLPTRARISLEARAGRKLFGAEALYSPEDTEQIWGSLTDIDFAASLATEIRAQVLRFEQEERARRVSSLDRMRQLGFKVDTIKRWFDNLNDNVADWGRDLIQDSAEEWGLAGDACTLPKPEDLPSLSSYVSYKHARIYLNNRLQKRIKGSDLYDAFHYAATPYADVIVTDDNGDGGFRETANLVSAAKPRFMSFSEFLGNLP